MRDKLLPEYRPFPTLEISRDFSMLAGDGTDWRKGACLSPNRCARPSPPSPSPFSIISLPSPALARAFPLVPNAFDPRPPRA